MRDLSEAFETALDTDAVAPVLFALAAGATGTLHLWSGVGPKEWNGITWTGAGDLASVEAIGETVDVKAVGLKATLSGIPPERVSWLLGETRSGKEFSIWFGVRNIETDDIVVDPDHAFRGFMDTAALEDGADSASISVTVENVLMRLEQPFERRWTHEDQKRDFPDDRGFEYVASIQDKEVKFAKK